MPSEDGPAADLTVRPADADDAEALATLFTDAREAAYPSMPRPVHPPADVRRWFRSRVEDEDAEVWLAERDAVPVAVLLLEDSWLHSLYVAPGLTGQGIGTVLVDLAKSLRPGGIGLWVFESNQGAQRFYRRHGFSVVRRTDDSENEEKEPDIEMAWRRDRRDER
jgi:ribosomal protein S18 acetylase RimI-like enzyme